MIISFYLYQNIPVILTFLCFCCNINSNFRGGAMFSLYDLRNNFSYYHDFYISAKEKSYAEAGRKNNITASSLTRSVRELEKALKLDLVNTSNTGFSLTLDGERLFKELETFFDSIKIFTADELANNLDVILTIGTTRNIADFGLEKYLTSFKKKFPNIKYHLLLDNANNLSSYILNRKIDVLIDYIPNNDIEKYNLEIKPIFQFKTCFACSKEFYNKHKDDIHFLKDLSNFELVVSGKSRRRQMLDNLLLKYNITLKIDDLMPDSKVMADYIKANDCIGYFIEDEIETYDLVKIELKEDTPINPVGIIYPKTINRVTKEFVELVLQESGFKNE